MTESKFKNIVKNILKEALEIDKYDVQSDKNLIYKVIVNESFKFDPNVPDNPRRGNYAFQTDLLITKNNNRLPLVVIETKYGGFSTHDVLTYSSKAQKHKEVFPYIRYGLLVGGTPKITNKFFIHNIGFDFALALEDTENNSATNELVEIIKDQINNAESILEVLRVKNKTKSFNTRIVIKKIDII
ncbi:hypothetical protein ACX8XN_15400 [Calditrichota bacterium GD2]